MISIYHLTSSNTNQVVKRHWNKTLPEKSWPGAIQWARYTEKESLHLLAFFLLALYFSNSFPLGFLSLFQHHQNWVSFYLELKRHDCVNPALEKTQRKNRQHWRREGYQEESIPQGFSIKIANVTLLLPYLRNYPPLPWFCFLLALFYHTG